MVLADGDSSANPANAWMDDPAQAAIVRQMQDDLRWAREHHEELERLYPGESVVVWCQEVVAHGIHEQTLLGMAASPERPREQLVMVEFPSFFESPH